MRSAIFLVLIVLTIIFFLPFLSGANIFGFRDLSLYFYPLRYLMVEMVKSGQLPLWNPYIYCGIPFFATLQAGFLYPLSILLYLLPFALGFNWFIIVHYLMAGFFTYLLMRHYQVKHSSAFFSALIFTFSGYLLSVLNMNTTLTSVVWLPLALLLWDKVLGHRSYLLGLILVLALMFLGGEPTILYSTFVILAIYSLFKGKIKELLYLPLLAVAIFALLAVQVLPFIEYALDSVRVWRTEFDFISQASFPVREIVNTIIPNFWGSHLTGTHLQQILMEKGQTWILSSYLGLIPLFFAFLSLRLKKTAVWFYSLTALFFLFLAFGKYTPVYQWCFYLLPGLSAIRYPVKFLFFPFFSLAILAGLGLDEAPDLINRRNLTLFSLFVPLLLIGSAMLWFFRIEIHTWLSLYLKLDEYNKIGLARLMAEDRTNLLIMASTIALVCSLLWLFFCRKISRAWMTYGVIAVVMADLFIFNSGLNQPVSANLFTEIPLNAEQLIADSSLFRYYVDHRIAGKSGGYFSSQSEILFYVKGELAANMLVPHHLYDWYGRESIEPLRNVRQYWAFREQFLNKRLEMLSRANVKYLLSYEKLRHPDLRLISDKNHYLYLNRGYYPRAYIKDGYAQIKLYQPNRVEMNVYSEFGGVLTLADNYYPGWVAYLDGKRVPIFREQYLYRGVSVPVGWHKLSFVYRPMSFLIGLVISLAAWAGLAGYSFLVLKKRR